jgi:hypothetical protein
MKLKPLGVLFVLIFNCVFLLISPISVFAAAIAVTGAAKTLNTDNSYLHFATHAANVTIDNSTGNFAGYAFLDDVGWVAFGTQDNPFGPVSLNLTTGSVTGKAKVLNTGVYMDFTSYSSNVTMSISTGVFSGYVFSEDVGWINFADTGVHTATAFDTTPPSAPGTPSTSTPTNSTTQTWLWTAATDALSGVANYAWRVTDPSDNPIMSGTTTGLSVVTNLVDGVWHFFVKAIDTTGNQGSESTSSVTVDTTHPTVTINQAFGQTDPINISPINFTVVFSEPVADFTTGDVTLSGTAGATTATVTGSGTTYNVAVSGMSGSGTINATIASGGAHDAANNSNDASTSTDNTVTYDIIPPTLTSITIASLSGFTNIATPTITIVSSNAPVSVAFSCNSGIDWSDWIAYADSISSFNITNGATGCNAINGSKTIIAKLKDALGNESGVVSDTISYDTTPPSAPGTPSTSTPTNATTQTWLWTAATDALSGVANYAWRVTDPSDNPIMNGTTTGLSVVTNLVDGVWHFFVKAIDTTGNQGSESTSSVTVDTTPTPTPTLVPTVTPMPTAVPTATPTPTPTVTTTPTIASNTPTATGVVNSTAAFGCGDVLPGAKAPWLYSAVAQDSSSILLFFTQNDAPVGAYVLEYGTKSGDYQYGTQNMGVNAQGNMTYRVSALSPNMTYYFRIRAGNGCAVGSWSNELSTKTLGLIATNQLQMTSSTLVPIVTKVKKNDSTKQNARMQAVPKIFSPTPSPSVKGYAIKVQVVDDTNKPVVGAIVTLHSLPQTTTTDKDGIAHFHNIEQGDHKVMIAYSGFKGEQSINLTGNVKQFALNVTVKPQNILLSPLVIGIISFMLLIIIALVITIVRLLRKKHHHKEK